MKHPTRICSWLLALCLVLAGLILCQPAAEAAAPDSVPINEQTFPDLYFRHYVSTNLDTDGNGLLSPEECAVTSIYCVESRVCDLTGIEYFRDLESLNCSYNFIETLDLRNQPKLRELDCCFNRIRQLDLSQNVALTTLHIYRNKLTALDLSCNPALTDLRCMFNGLTVLDVSAQTELELLQCHDNPLSALTLGSKPRLASLLCRNNQLTVLDLSGCTALTDLDCSGNRLTSLDCTAAPGLRAPVTDGNRFELAGRDEIDLGTLPGSFDVSKVLDVQGGSFDARTNTFSFDPWSSSARYCYGSADVYGTFTLTTSAPVVRPHPVPGELAVDETAFPDADLRNLILRSFDEDRSGGLSDTEIQNATVLDCRAGAYLPPVIEDLTGIEHLPALQSLFCGGNANLTALDLSRNTRLQELDCSGCGLTALTLGQMDALTDLNCSENPGLDLLKLDGCPALLRLNCSGCGLTELDLSTAAMLTELRCSGTALSDLNLSNNPALESVSAEACGLYQLTLAQQMPSLTVLDVSGNHLATLEPEGCPALQTLDASDNALTSLDLSRNPKLSRISLLGNRYQLPARSGNKLQQLPGVFDASKVSNVANGSFDAKTTVFSFAPGCDEAAYDYDTGAATALSVTLFTRAPADGELAINSETFPDSNFCNYVRDHLDANRNRYLSDAERNAVLEIDLNGLYVYDLTGIGCFPNLQKLNISNTYVDRPDLSGNPRLQVLSCWFCSFSELDLRGCPALQTLNAGHSALTALDLSGNPDLRTLDVSYNQLTALDLSHAPLLTELSCTVNQLTALDVSHNPALIRLSCDQNPITNLVLTNNPVLESLDCSNCRLSQLDVSKLSSLRWLSCSDNQLTALDVTQNRLLSSLVCHNNFLAALDVRHNPKLNYFVPGGQQLTIPVRTGFDCTTLPNFDISRVRNVSGGHFDARTQTFSFDPGRPDATYEYDTGLELMGVYLISEQKPEPLPLRLEFVKKGLFGPQVTPRTLNPGDSVRAPRAGGFLQKNAVWQAEGYDLVLKSNESLTYERAAELLGGTVPVDAVIRFTVSSSNPPVPPDPSEPSEPVAELQVKFVTGKFFGREIGKTVTVREGGSVTAPAIRGLHSRNMVWTADGGSLTVNPGDTLTYEQLKAAAGGSNMLVLHKTRTDIVH